MAKRIDMKALAERGAAARVTELRAEIEAIFAAFPGLRGRGGPRRRTQASGAANPGRRRRRMSAAQRRAVSARMKAFWAQRRKSKAAAGK